jgi:hypothetical protein
MGFSAKQLQALRRQPSRCHIRTRQANGPELSYLEGWYAISEANRIFGFDGWSRETLESRCVLARETRGTFLAVYFARVRFAVHADCATIIREGHGTGEGRGTSPGAVHDIALKAAETDASKRALATVGKQPFGLELYRNGKTAAPKKSLPSPPGPDLAAAGVGFHPDDTTPIPRPSRCYGRRQNQSAERLSGERRHVDRTQRRHWRQQHQIRFRFKSIIVGFRLPKPKRLRGKRHLKFVASQPCLVSGRQPSDPHHLRFRSTRSAWAKGQRRIHSAALPWPSSAIAPGPQ